jgi:hypothetical protein
LLSLPPGMTGIVAIPDSVEVLSFVRACKDGDYCALTFTSDSRLTDLKAPLETETHHGPGFLRVSTQSLKRFRMNWEFTLSP